MILDIDIGNTMTKWRLSRGSSITARGRIATMAFPDASVLSLTGVQRVRVAAVCHRDQLDSIVRQVQETLAAPVDVAKTAAHAAGVTNAYGDPAQMGVDRWLAMLAAFHMPELHSSANAGCMVVSCGTAVTMDFVRRDGLHEGGFIIPGIYMMREALRANTGRIRFEADGFDISREPGDGTAKAVEHGAVHAILSAIEQGYMRGVSRWGGVVLVMTGGDARALAAILQLPATIVDELVMDGLGQALP